MKKIGLVGGIGPASTVEYYLGIIEKCRKAQGEHAYPEIVIDSVNMLRHDTALFEQDYGRLCDSLICSLSNLKAAGAEIAAITANPIITYVIICMSQPPSRYLLLYFTTLKIARAEITARVSTEKLFTILPNVIYL